MYAGCSVTYASPCSRGGHRPACPELLHQLGCVMGENLRKAVMWTARHPLYHGEPLTGVALDQRREEWKRKHPSVLMSRVSASLGTPWKPSRPR